MCKLFISKQLEHSQLDGLRSTRQSCHAKWFDRDHLRVEESGQDLTPYPVRFRVKSSKRQLAESGRNLVSRIPKVAYAPLPFPAFI